MSERMDLSDVPEGILITRPFDMVTMMHLSPGTVSFLKAVSSRHSFAQALEVALKTEPTVNRAAMLTLLSHAGAFAGCEESSLG